MKNVLIIGGTGTLGKELCHQLAAENSYQITVLTRKPNENTQNTEGGPNS